MLATLEVAATRRDRRRGLLGRDTIEGAFYLPGVKALHTVGMRVSIDVAFVRAVDAPSTVPIEGAPPGHVVEVVAVRHMPRHRIGMPVLKATGAIEAADGAFRRWELRVGDQLELRAST